MAKDIQITDELLADILEDYPTGGLTWALAKEIIRLRTDISRLGSFLHPIGEQIRYK